MPILLFFMLVGAVGLFGVPLRLWQLTRRTARLIWAQLQPIPKWLTILGLMGLALATILWAVCVYVIGVIVSRGGPDGIWGGSEIAMTLDALGLIYFLVELMLLPVTLRQLNLQAGNLSATSLSR